MENGGWERPFLVEETGKSMDWGIGGERKEHLDPSHPVELRMPEFGAWSSPAGPEGVSGCPSRD